MGWIGFACLTGSAVQLACDSFAWRTHPFSCVIA
jgi:hypothetical protein